ncbi:MAG TPA: hypothetical protein VFP93_05460, partial [Gammaproteobacteria bacterium]|nr:hypothetical protein [Gammaproteobacteria bacterium]
ITNGSLIIEGDVHDRSYIEITTNTKNVSFWQKVKNFYFQPPITSNLNVEGNVGNNVQFVIEGSILIGGDIKNYNIINAQNGDIHVGNVGIGTQLTSTFGSVHCMKVNREVKLTTFFGKANTSDNKKYQNSIFDLNYFSQLFFLQSAKSKPPMRDVRNSITTILDPNIKRSTVGK